MIAGFFSNSRSADKMRGIAGAMCIPLLVMKCCIIISQSFDVFNSISDSVSPIFGNWSPDGNYTDFNDDIVPGSVLLVIWIISLVVFVSYLLFLYFSYFNIYPTLRKLPVSELSILVSLIDPLSTLTLLLNDSLSHYVAFALLNHIFFIFILLFSLMSFHSCFMQQKQVLSSICLDLLIGFFVLSQSISMVAFVASFGFFFIMPTSVAIKWTFISLAILFISLSIFKTYLGRIFVYYLILKRRQQFICLSFIVTIPCLVNPIISLVMTGLIGFIITTSHLCYIAIVGLVALVIGAIIDVIFLVAFYCFCCHKCSLPHNSGFTEVHDNEEQNTLL